MLRSMSMKSGVFLILVMLRMASVAAENPPQSNCFTDLEGYLKIKDTLPKALRFENGGHLSLSIDSLFVKGTATASFVQNDKGDSVFNLKSDLWTAENPLGKNRQDNVSFKQGCLAKTATGYSLNLVSDKNENYEMKVKSMTDMSVQFSSPESRSKAVRHDPTFKAKAVAPAPAQQQAAPVNPPVPPSSVTT